MKGLILTVALLAATPAMAITANGGTVNSAASVTVNGSNVGDTGTDTAAGLPTSLFASSIASFSERGNTIKAYSSVNASWASATQGSATLTWGWDAFNPDGLDIDQFETRVAGNDNWTYSFTTGAGAATFAASWTLAVSGSNTFGLQGIYSFDGISPFYITPSQLSPTSGSGSYSIALAPNTSYTLSFANFGNLGGYLGDVSGNFNLDWRITTTAIPEPASWAMLIAGFGLVGATARRRRALA